MPLYYEHTGSQYYSVHYLFEQRIIHNKLQNMILHIRIFYEATSIYLLLKNATMTKKNQFAKRILIL